MVRITAKYWSRNNRSLVLGELSLTLSLVICEYLIAFCCFSCCYLLFHYRSMWENLWCSKELLYRIQRAEKIFLRSLWSFPKGNLFFAKDKVSMLVNGANFWESTKQNKQSLNRLGNWTENRVGLNLEILWLINPEKIPNFQVDQAWEHILV